MRTACDNLIEQTVFFGDPAVGFRGFLNYQGITVTNAVNGASKKATWADKTAAEIIKDVNDAINKVWTDSKGVFLPNTVFLPLAQYALINQLPMVLSGGQAVLLSAAEYLKKNNIFTNLRGQDLQIIPIRYLAKAGAASADRMVVMDRSKRNQGLPFPMPYTVQAPVPVPLGSEFYAEQKHGSYFIRQNLSTLYVDGI